MLPACMHCGEDFDLHESHPERDTGRARRWCRRGDQSFDCVFTASPEVVDFVRANLEKSSKELAEMWIARLTNRAQSRHCSVPGCGESGVCDECRTRGVR